ncbi:MAG: hypothetical protein NTZ69_13295 [Bacteroidia bacterium]|nr:hypothetical protein [Bacteroidia bacterium]
MKKSILFASVLFCIFFLVSSELHAKKNQIYGFWNLSSGKHNGTSAPKVFSNRIQKFNMNNTFESQYLSEKGLWTYNNGMFYLLNDSTIVTYHKNPLGKTDNIGNTYNYSIKNDTLHFYGFYLRQLPQNPSMILKVYIDEWWVRSTKQ